MTSWIITAVLALVISWIVYTEVRGGRQSRSFLAKFNEETDTLRRNATVAYRAKFGRDPTAPFIRIDDDHRKLSSKKP